jgi:ureidoglycolate dehydrogenase (NAD+)
MDRAIRLAKRSGVGVVGIFNSTHCGSLGLYTRQAAAERMIGISFTHTDSLLQTYGGSRPFFGTNPISIAFPWPVREPLCVDMATSIVPWNKVQNARIAGTFIPAGWAVDENGNECTDPRRAVAVKPMGAHKGYALSFIIDMLCGPLNGMAFGPHIVSMYGELGKKRRLGSLVMAIDPARFPGGATLSTAIRRAIREVTSEKRTVLYPGQPEYIAQRQRKKRGIPIPPSLQSEFDTWSRRLRIAAPRYRA